MAQAPGLAGRAWCWVACLLVALLTGAPSATARADDAPQSGVDRVALLSRARAYVSAGRAEDARPLAVELLRRSPRDDEARALIARLDAWAGNDRQAEEGYRAVLRRHPEDAEVRAGLIDLLLWRGRWTEAEREIERGLALGDDAGLWTRRARLAQWRGDATAARSAIEHARVLAPEDPEVLALADRIFLGEVRFESFRDLYPAGYSEMWGLHLSGLVRWEKLTFTVGTEQTHRSASTARGGYNNALYTTGVARAVAPWMDAAFELGLGTPVVSYPWAVLRASVSWPRLGPVSASLTVSGLRYRRGRWVYAIAPVVSVPLGDALRLDIAYWLELLDLPASRVLPEDHQLLHAGGAQLVWSVLPRLSLATMWTWGAGVEEVDGLPERLSTSTQSLRVSFDWLVHQGLGLSPRWRVEVRTTEGGRLVPVHRLELAAYSRW